MNSIIINSKRGLSPLTRRLPEVFLTIVVILLFLMIYYNLANTNIDHHSGFSVFNEYKLLFSESGLLSENNIDHLDYNNLRQSNLDKFNFDGRNSGLAVKINIQFLIDGKNITLYVNKDNYDKLISRTGLRGSGSADEIILERLMYVDNYKKRTNALIETTFLIPNES